jgi:lipopolysaccharide transport system ATP-binding protein
MSDVVVAESVSKKFCRDLRRGMRYAAADLTRSCLGLSRRRAGLRPGEFWAVEDVTFALKQGECLGVVGQNGAGKSTLVKLLSGIIPPDRGRIRIRGRTAALIEVGAGFHPSLTGRENIYLNGAILGLSRREIDRRFDAIVDFAGLEDEVLDALVRTYSTGMHVRLGFAVAIQCEPDVIVVDEVLAVGDMTFQARCLSALGTLQHGGTAFVLVSHNLDYIGNWADHAIALDHGRVFAAGAPQEVIQQYVQRTAMPGLSGHPGGRTPNGTGRARILSIAFLDEHGREVDSVRAGQPVAVGVELEADELISDVELDLRISNQYGDLVSGTSSRTAGAGLPSEGRTQGSPLESAATWLCVPAGKSEIRAAYPPVPLNRGCLRAAAALWRGDRTEMMDWFEGRPVWIAGSGEAEGEAYWLPEYSVRSPASP